MNKLNYKNSFPSIIEKNSLLDYNRKKIISSRSLKNTIFPKNIIKNKKEISNFSTSSIKDNDNSCRNRTLSLIKVSHKKHLINDNKLNDYSDNNNNIRLKKYHFEDFKYSKHFGNIDKCPICQAQNMKNRFFEKSIGIQNNNFIKNNNLTPTRRVFNLKKKKIIKHVPLKSRNGFNIKSINLNEFQKAKLEYLKYGNGGNLFSNYDNNNTIKIKREKEKEKDNSISTYSDKYSAIFQYFKP